MIDRLNIENWASTIPAKAEFPELILRLVLATIPHCQNKVDIPIGSSTYMGGWDGLINTEEGTTFIPEGTSGWEFGTSGDASEVKSKVQNKADNDYEKRTNALNPNYNMSEMTFVFVTPWVWAKKDEWVEKRKKEGKWKDIIVYDSDRLSQWLRTAPAVEKWLARKVGINSAIEYDTVEEKWNDYIYGNQPFQLTPDFYTCGRENIVLELEKKLQSKQPFIMGIEASSREEAEAFILAAGNLFSQNEKDLFKSKGVVVYNKAVFRELIGYRNSICFIPIIDDLKMVYSVLANNHSAIIPLSQDDEFTTNKIKLPISNKNRLVDILVSYGINKPEAEKLVRNNSCNIALIRKELDFPPFRADWQKIEDLKELMPALLLGKWSDNFKGDNFLLSLLSEKDYKDYYSRLVYWSKLPVSPIINIGNIWRTTSPLSLWSALSDALRTEQLDTLSKMFEIVFVKSDGEYSKQLKKGILENCIIIALYGKRMGIVGDGQKWTDSLVEKLLETGSPQKLAEFSDYLPLLAEASPTVFLDTIQSVIANHKDVISYLFIERDGFSSPDSHHTNLLWALEALAWLPDYLQQVTEILLYLSEIDPGGRLANRPFNSLITIYLFWFPQTSAKYDKRLNVLENCIKKGYSLMWDLLLALLPNPNATSMQTYKLKWRDFEFEERQNVNGNEMMLATEWVVEHLMSMYNGNDADLSKLIEKIEPIYPSIRRKLIAWLPLSVDTIKDNDGVLTRKTLRETIWYQYLDGINSHYSFTNNELQNIVDAYQKLSPTDLKKRHQWLFDEDFPHLAQKIINDPNDENSNIQQINQLRKEACEELLKEYDLEDVISMKDNVGTPRTLGISLAQFHSINGLTDKVCELLSNDKDYYFVVGYLGALDSLLGLDKIREVYRSCESKGFTDEALTLLLLSVYPRKELWLFIDELSENVQNLYWQKTQGYFYGPFRDELTYQIGKFIDAGRAIDAINQSWIHVKNLSTDMIQQLLKASVTETTILNSRPFDHLALESYMEELHRRTDVDQNLLFKLEWTFLPKLVYHSEKVCLNSIFSHLEKDPSFFVELLTYLYKPDNGIEEDDDGTDDLTNQANSSRAFHLFYHWKKIPYVTQEGMVDTLALTNWVNKALCIAKEKKRLTAAYIQLGGLFAHYGEGGVHAPELFSIMESIDDDSFFDNYRVGLFNKRGFTIRGPYDGGDIERRNKSFFENLYTCYHVQFPKVAKVFKVLTIEYADMAKQMDEEADMTKLDY